jgi:hypothetical protein
MGSVGSSSVTKSLKLAEMDRNIYHIHFLKPELIKKYETKRKPSFHIKKGGGGLKHIWQYEYLYDLVQRNLNGKKWKIITMVRDPIARNLSDFFEHIEVIPTHKKNQQIFKSKEHGYEVVIRDNDPSKLIELFFEKFDHNSPTTYFDREFKGVLNIDLYANKFPKSKGYKIYNEDTADILLIKLEHIDGCIESSLKEFIDVEITKLVVANIGEQKPYGAIYRQFKSKIRFPQTFLDNIYTSKFVQHFYADSEIKLFRDKWSRDYKI